MAGTKAPMKHKGRLRGDVVSVLNRLVREGIICAYMTNLGAKQATVVTVTRTPGESSDDELSSYIRQALAHLVAEVAVVVALEGPSG